MDQNDSTPSVDRTPDVLQVGVFHRLVVLQGHVRTGVVRVDRRLRLNPLMDETLESSWWYPL